MNYIFKNFIYKHKKLSITLLFVLMFFFIGQYIGFSTIYHSIASCYAKLLGNTTAVLLHFLGFETSYISSKDQLITVGYNVCQLIPILALKFYFITFLIIFLFPKEYKKSFMLFLIVFFILFLLSVIKASIFSVYVLHIRYFFDSLIYSCRYFIIFFLIIYRIKQFAYLKLRYDKINSFLSSRFHVKLLLFYILFVPSLLILDVFLYDYDNFFIKIYTNQLLSLSKDLFSLFGQEVVISKNYIYWDKYWVGVGGRCLGLELMLFFVLLVSIINSNWKNKLIYVIFGLVTMFLLNVVRISYLLFSVYKNKGEYTLVMDIHDLSNYYFYAIVFILFVIYVYWFQDINLSKKKK